MFGAGGPWPSLVRYFEMHGGRSPEVFLTDKYPNITKLLDLESLTANRIHFLQALDRRNANPGTPSGI